MARTDPQINLRIPADLKARLEAVALASGRSTNAEIVWRLEQSLLPEGSAREMGSGIPPSAQMLDTRLGDIERMGNHSNELQRQMNALQAQLAELEKNPSPEGMRPVTTALKRLHAERARVDSLIKRLWDDVYVLRDHIDARSKALREDTASKPKRGK